MIKAITRAVLVSIVAGSPLLAQSDVSPRPGIHVIDYAVSIDLPDSGSSINGDATLTVQRTGTVDTLTLDFLKLGVSRVTINDRATKFVRTDSTIDIPLPRGIGLSGRAKRLTSEGAAGGFWSRDGKIIAYAGFDGALRVIPAQGGPEKVVVPPTLFGRATDVGGWSADSRKIYFRVHAPDGNLNIAQVSLDGSNPSLLVHFDDSERRGYRSEFSTDGTTIYVTVGKHEADIWVMDVKKK